MSTKGLRAYYSVQVNCREPRDTADAWKQISETGTREDAIARARRAADGYGEPTAVRVERVVAETVFELDGE